MAINYANLFGDLGEIYDTIADIESFGATMVANKAAVITQLNSTGETDLISSVNQTFDSSIAAINTMLNSMVNLAKQRMVSKSSVIAQLPSLVSTDYNSVVYELIDDMVKNSQTIKKSSLTVGGITKTSVNANAGSLIVTKKLPGNTLPGNGMYQHIEMTGVDGQLTLTDSFVVTVTSDSQASGGGNETFTITSLPAAAGPFTVQGGGNPGTSNFSPTKGKSIISNFFSSFTGTVPTGWTALDATDYAAETSVVMFAGTSCLKIISAGTLSYDFSSRVRPGDMLSLSFYLRKVTGETGSINVKAYVNGSAVVNQTIVTGSVSNSAWTLFNYDVPITKEVGSCYLEIISTSITNGYYIDNGALSPYHYHAGLGFAVTRGTEVFVQGDDFRFTTTNDNAGKQQKLMSRVFGFQPPTATSGSETVAEP
jgi:hypothetical protein